MKDEKPGKVQNSSQSSKLLSASKTPKTQSLKGPSIPHLTFNSSLNRVDSKTEFSIFEKAIAQLEEEDEKEESFVDDDGTHYVWNSKLKKYEPQDSVSYDQETMTFTGVEDSTPSLEETLSKASHVLIHRLMV